MISSLSITTTTTQLLMRTIAKSSSSHVIPVMVGKLVPRAASLFKRPFSVAAASAALPRIVSLHPSPIPSMYSHQHQQRIMFSTHHMGDGHSSHHHESNSHHHNDNGSLMRKVNKSDVESIVHGHEQALLIDVRHEDETNAGRIPTSVCIPLAELMEALQLNELHFEKTYGFPKPTPDTKMVFYCRSGVRSALAQAAATQLGYKNVFDYSGSWLDWVDTHPIEKPQVKESDQDKNDKGPGLYSGTLF